MKRILLTFFTLLSLAMSVPLLAGPQMVLADAKSDVCSGIGTASGGKGCGGSGTSLTHVISAVVNILSLMAGVVAVIMILVAGFRYITSGGDAGKVSGAKGALVYAVVGLIIAAMAQAIVKFVLDKAGS
jgi:Type IV secretion system pilin